MSISTLRTHRGQIHRDPGRQGRVLDLLDLGHRPAEKCVRAIGVTPRHRDLAEHPVRDAATPARAGGLRVGQCRGGELLGPGELAEPAL
jgi:hypothetical protein